MARVAHPAGAAQVDRAVALGDRRQAPDFRVKAGVRGDIGNAEIHTAKSGQHWGKAKGEVVRIIL
jgi:uncharacterized protein (DUF736 family)